MVRTIADYTPEYYESHLRELDGTPAERFIVSRLEGWILDVGCGLGRFPSDIGIDPSSYAVAHNQRKNAIVGEAERIPMPDRSFDTVLCNHAIEHVKDVDKAMNEFARVSRKRLVLAYPNKDYLPYRLHLRKQHSLHLHEFGKDFCRPPWHIVEQRVFRFGYNIVSILEL